MPNVTALGLSKIEVADIDATTGLPVSTGTGAYATLGKTYENTCKLVEDDPEVTEFYCEEEDDPQEEISKKGKTTLTFSIMNANATAMGKIFGGTVTPASSGNPATWEAPDNLTVQEKAVKISPRIGGIIELRRVKLTAKVNAEYSKKGLFLIDVKGTVCKPLVTGVKSIKFTDAE